MKSKIIAQCLDHGNVVTTTVIGYLPVDKNGRVSAEVYNKLHTIARARMLCKRGQWVMLLCESPRFPGYFRPLGNRG